MIRQGSTKVRAGFLAAALAVIAAAGASSIGAAQDGPGIRRSGGSLTAFRSDADLRAFLLRVRREQARQAAMVSAPAPVAEAAAEPGAIMVTGSRIPAPGITNNQTAGVDEGGIVKLRGETLVILRRGRLFTVSLAGGRMRPIDSINAFPPGVSGRGDWYDEMLISGDRVIVVGYSYARGGTEINRFRIDPSGRLRFEDAYHLRSNDYYSSRNYASRLMGTKLIYYTPLYLGYGRDPLDNFFPGIRRWRDGSTERNFQRIGSARQIYIPPAMRSGRDVDISALHSVMTCDLAAATLDCDAVGILGPSSRTFYVSGDAVYLWISDAWSASARRRGANSYVYRLPFDGERPSAIGARGAPIDQFSFREDAADGVVNVLLRSEGGGDAMWRPEFSAGAIALLRLPLREFGDGSREAAWQRYRPLPSLGGHSYNFRNRFVGNHVLYGGGGVFEDGIRRRRGDMLVAAPVRGGAVTQLSLPHDVGRIEALGRDALVVGSDEEALGFSAVELGATSAGLGDRYTLPAASEGESRSHAFFFSPDARTPDGASGTLGLPVARAVEPAYRRFFGSSAAMLFLRRDARRFSPAGELAARSAGVADDGCQASCVDWYGNARPIFMGPRTFALLGYELVEGNLSNGRIREVGRVNFAPRARPRPRG